MKKQNLFISWSGELSKKIAKELKEFFEETLQNMDPFFSPDIPKGTGWLEQLNTAINNSTAGILCLTKENNMKPWVLFESGALSRVGLVCPIVFDLKKEKVKSPLNIFQSSEFNKEEFKKLFEDINSSCGSGLHQKVIDRIFENNGRFDVLERKIMEILASYEHAAISKDETLEILKNLDSKISRLLHINDSTSLDVKYLELLVDGFLELLKSIDIIIASNFKEQFQKISFSIDYLISNNGTDLKNTSLKQKNERINDLIEAL